MYITNTFGKVHVHRTQAVLPVSSDYTSDMIATARVEQ
jgi:hypothetical protein